jgi:hypothetical protein
MEVARNLRTPLQATADRHARGTLIPHAAPTLVTDRPRDKPEFLVQVSLAKLSKTACCAQTGFPARSSPHRCDCIDPRHLSMAFSKTGDTRICFYSQLG